MKVQPRKGLGRGELSLIYLVGLNLPKRYQNNLIIMQSGVSLLNFVLPTADNSFSAGKILVDTSPNEQVAPKVLVFVSS